MVEKDGKEGEEEAKKAYRAAREETDQDAEKDVDEKVSSALINRVHIFRYSYVMISANRYHSVVNLLFISYLHQRYNTYNMYLNVTVHSIFKFQVDAMLQKLEKEIDDVDAKIGDRWRLLDRLFNGF